MGEETVTFSLNDTEVTVPKGWTVMQAAREKDVYIPHFCWHPGLPIAGVCRFCMVKVEGRPKLEIACNLAASDGMKVYTNDEEVTEAHKWALEFHLVNHPLDCPICDQAGECGLQDYYMEVGKYKSQMVRPKVLKPKALPIGSELVLDTERCILCDRCVRFEDNVTKTGALGIFNRGDRAVVGTYPDKKIEHDYQTNLVDICPVGAFTSKDFRFKQRVWFLEDKPSVCPGCSTGCAVDVYGKPQVRTYFRVKPRESEVNGHWMCDKGRDTYQHMNQEKRQRQAVFTENGTRRQGSANQAIGALLAKMDEVDPSEIALLVSAQYTNEEYTSLFKWFVTERGVKNVFQWREPTENREDFDGILLRGDRNANTAGLQAALKAAGFTAATIANQFDQVATSGAKVLIALAPEVPATFPSLEGQVSSLEELPYVSLWTCADLGRKHQGIANIIPMKGFAEKTGTFTNFSGELRSLEQAFPGASSEARTIVEVIQALGGQGPLSTEVN